jgi:hypothetical protein
VWKWASFVMVTRRATPRRVHAISRSRSRCRVACRSLPAFDFRAAVDARVDRRHRSLSAYGAVREWYVDEPTGDLVEAVFPLDRGFRLLSRVTVGFLMFIGLVAIVDIVSRPDSERASSFAVYLLCWLALVASYGFGRPSGCPGASKCRPQASGSWLAREPSSFPGEVFVEWRLLDSIPSQRGSCGSGTVIASGRGPGTRTSTACYALSRSVRRGPTSEPTRRHARPTNMRSGASPKGTRGVTARGVSGRVAAHHRGRTRITARRSPFIPT